MRLDRLGPKRQVGEHELLCLARRQVYLAALAQLAVDLKRESRSGGLVTVVANAREELEASSVLRVGAGSQARDGLVLAIHPDRDEPNVDPLRIEPFQLAERAVGEQVNAQAAAFRHQRSGQ